MSELALTGGIVVKGLGGLFEVVTDGDRRRIPCRARGNLHKNDAKLLVGDRVLISEPSGSEAVVEQILPRKNALIRPPMANLDTIYAVIASAKPAPILETVDKLLAIAEHNGIRVALIITKSDFDPSAAERYAEVYRRVGIPVFTLSAMTGDGVGALEADISEQMRNGAVAALTGASGVGKSTLLNRLFPELSLSTGEISRKIERGRHTTRHVELFPVREGGFLADTPGFSLLDFVHFDFFELDDLFDSFREFAPYRGECRYSDCTHTGEGRGECAIAKAVSEGLIPESRHESYRTLYRILKEKTKYRS